jgi:hypothetical protein
VWTLGFLFLYFVLVMESWEDELERSLGFGLGLCGVIGNIVIISYTRIIFLRVLHMGQLSSEDVSG